MMYSNGLHSSSHVVDSTTSELAVMSYMRISMLLFVGVIFRGSFGCNSIVGVDRINLFRVMSSGDDHAGVLG